MYHVSNPVTREYLLGLKAQTDEETRVKRVNEYAQHTFRQVINTATTTTQTRYQQPLQKHDPQYIRDNMPDILDKLRDLFPDSKVDFKSLSRGQDGKMYDIADIDERMKPFINTQFNQDFIVIDWS
uniref:Uncharacterized protein n=1 Tax=viral metagenome TaxID=1070528 RepID=A0A6C0HFI4_9ZZZZ